MKNSVLISGQLLLAALLVLLASAACGRLADPPWLTSPTPGTVPLISGQCKFGNETLGVEIFDQVRPGKLDPFTVTLAGNKATSLKAGDLLAVTPKNRPAIIACYGHPVQVNSAWYTVTVPANSKTPVVQRFTGPTGKVVIKHASWSATFVGKKYVLNLTGGAAPITIPCDTYTVSAYAEGMKTKDGQALLLSDFPNFNRGKVYQVGGTTVTVPANKTVAVAIGSPVIARVEVEYLERRQVYFSFVTTNAAGGQVSVKLPRGQMPKTPSVTIVNAEGQKLTSFRLEYGWGGNCSHTWRVPTNIKDQLTARLTYQAGPFQTITKETKFSVE